MFSEIKKMKIPKYAMSFSTFKSFTLAQSKLRRKDYSKINEKLWTWTDIETDFNYFLKFKKKYYISMLFIFSSICWWIFEFSGPILQLCNTHLQKINKITNPRLKSAKILEDVVFFSIFFTIIKWSKKKFKDVNFLIFLTFFQLVLRLCQCPLYSFEMKYNGFLIWKKKIVYMSFR